jgi:electron transfer flavoprotein alpha subunit
LEGVGVSDASGLPIYAIVLADDGESSDRSGSAAFAGALGRGASARALVFGRAVEDSFAHSVAAEGVAAATIVENSGLSIPLQAAELLPLVESALAHLGVRSDDAALILAPSGSVGEELASTLAARMNGDALGRCSEISIDAHGVDIKRPSFGGRMLVRLSSRQRPAFAVVRRPVGMKPAPDGGANAPIERMKLDISLPSQQHIVHGPPDGDRHARLIGAKIVIGGGRGIGGPEGFEQLRELAALLDGAFGGSLPTVDAGWTPVSQQIGQSGHYVAADLYVAVGVSGTPSTSRA